MIAKSKSKISPEKSKFLETSKSYSYIVDNNLFHGKQFGDIGLFSILKRIFFFLKINIKTTKSK